MRPLRLTRSTAREAPKLMLPIQGSRPLTHGPDAPSAQHGAGQSPTRRVLSPPRARWYSSPVAILPVLAFALVILAVGAAAPCGSVAHADVVWTPEDGWFIPSRRVRPGADELLTNSAKAFEAERFADAAEGYGLYLEYYAAADEANFSHQRHVESLYRAKLYDDALQAIKRLLARKPSGPIVNFAIQRQYDIGLAYLTGHPRSFLGIPFPGESYGVELLDSVVQRFPYQRFSDDALYHIAAYYQREEKFEQAEIIYKRVIADYPQSEWTGIAEYQIGISAFSRLKGVDYDLTPLDEAERRFNRYLSVYPRGERAPDARAKLTEINRLRAEKILGIARFYQREGKSTAVRYYLQKLLRNHPDAPAAEEARRLLKRFGGDRGE